MNTNRVATGTISSRRASPPAICEAHLRIPPAPTTFAANNGFDDVYYLQHNGA